MRIWSTVLMAVLLPAAGRAQAFQFRSPAPEVTAATAVWQVSSQPIVVQGLMYLPTRDYRHLAVFQRRPLLLRGRGRSVLTRSLHARRSARGFPRVSRQEWECERDLGRGDQRRRTRRAIPSRGQVGRGGRGRPGSRGG